jgi:hypothetical protein
VFTLWGLGLREEWWIGIKKAKGKIQNSKGKRQKAKGKRQKAKKWRHRSFVASAS